jgi:hypothetical protein
MESRRTNAGAPAADHSPSPLLSPCRYPNAAVGLGVPYSIAVALFGGTAPYVQTYFAERGMPAGFNWYAITLAVISILTILTLKETKGKDLTVDD